MAWQKKKFKEPYMTQADRERIARIEHNPHALARKFKSLLTLKKNGSEQEVCIYVYGESEDAVKTKAAEHVKFFQDHDKTWKMLSLKSLNNNASSDDASDEPEKQAVS